VELIIEIGVFIIFNNNFISFSMYSTWNVFLIKIIIFNKVDIYFCCKKQVKWLQPLLFLFFA